MPAEIPDAAQLLAAHTHAADPTPAGPPSGGRIVYLPPGADHTCTPPVRPVTGFVIHLGRPRPTEPAAPDGAVWRCTCGRSWTAAPLRNTRTWRPATWTERLKARLFSHRGPTHIIDSTTVTDGSPAPASPTAAAGPAGG